MIYLILVQCQGFFHTENLVNDLWEAFLQHTYATMRISEGVSVFQLAANMGTSVEMIESFYGKKRMRDPKMATEVTKFRGR